VFQSYAVFYQVFNDMMWLLAEVVSLCTDFMFFFYFLCTILAYVYCIDSVFSSLICLVNLFVHVTLPVHLLPFSAVYNSLLMRTRFSFIFRLNFRIKSVVSESRMLLELKMFFAGLCTSALTQPRSKLSRGPNLVECLLWHWPISTSALFDLTTKCQQQLE